MKEIVAIDFGFGFTKIKTDSAQKRIPSYLGTSDSKSEDLKGRVTYDMTEYVVGDDVKYLPTKINIATIDELIKYYPIFLKWILEDQCYEPKDVFFVTGLPPMYKERKDEILEIFKKIGANGEVVSQSIGIFVDSAKYVKTETVLVLDIGYNTLDYLVLAADGNGSWRKVRSGTLLGQGVNKALEFFKENISGFAAIRSQATNTLLRPFEEGKMFMGGEMHDLSSAKETAISKYVELINGRLKSELGELLTTVEQTILGGGGANFIDPDTLGFKNVIKPEKPEFAQARGYYAIGKEAIEE